MAPAELGVTVYPVMGEPPSLTGGVQRTVADVSPGAAVGIDGGKGAPAFSVVRGWTGSTTGDRGAWLKSKSAVRLPRIGTSSRTSGRGSGRPSVCGFSR